MTVGSGVALVQMQGDGRLGAVAGAELVQDIADVRFDRLLGDMQGCRDLR